ncbi:MAG: amidohydrolase [Lachnospiraceae bacterium]|nr:amidohydrolase [Lachnospiraceae bacterium]
MITKINNIRTLVFEQDIPVIKEADIYIKDDRIDAVYFDHEDYPEQPGYEIEGAHRLAIPGLINAHTHAYMTMFRNIADDVPFTKWLFDTISPLEDAMTDEECYFGSQLANLEMIRTGTTSYVDMHMTPGVNAKSAIDSGMRVYLTRGLVGDKKDDEGGLRRLREALDDEEKFGDGDMVMTMLGPHAPYSCGPEYLAYIAGYAKEKGYGLNIHLAEGENEIKTIKEKYGLTPIEYADKAGVFDVRAIAAHCVYLSDSDYDILSSKHVNVAVNPVSNMKLANGFSDVPGMLEKKINVCIGTDGAASNNTLNLFREMAFEAMIHKGLLKKAETVPASEVIRMATVNGAKALGRESDLGQIAKGFKADLTILDLHSPQLTPADNLISALVYSCSGNEVDTVIVNGKILMEKKEMKTIDEEKIYFEMDKIGKRYAGIVRR